MSQARLYLDEDAMRRALVFGLRTRNVDVLTASETEMINRDDQDHLATASGAEPRRASESQIAGGQIAQS